MKKIILAAVFAFAVCFSADAQKTKDEKQKAFEEKYGTDKNKESKDFTTKKEYKEYKSDRKKLEKSESKLKEAEKNYQLTEDRIQNFAKVDPENFAKVDNLTYKSKSGKELALDVVVKEGLTGDFGRGFTSYLVRDATGRITGNVLNITIGYSASINSNVLAHEFGHAVTIASDPVGYKNALTSGHNCQDPSNRDSFISKTALDWQERYDRLKK